MRKKQLALVLALAMVLSMMVVPVSAEDADIPDDAVSYGGHYYKIYTDSVTWTEAEARCEALGGYLATITSADEQAFIDEYNSSSKRLWIGGYREDDNTVWMWVTGETWDYTNWGDGEPNNSSNVVSNENRTVLWSGGYWNDLNDDNTSESAGYICEWGDAETDSGSDDGTTNIPDDAVAYDGHYYKIYTDSVTWTEAKAQCEAMGGYLATITSADEQAFIDEYNSSSKHLWVGGYREDDNTVWMWVTGETWDYTNWGDGEPNNSSNVVSNENRTVLWSSGYWNDLNDDNTSESAGYICEWGDTAELVDTDGDGLPDEWEINGVDTDGDGNIDIHLELMGADPNVPDVFVEIDWMYQEEKKFLFWTTQKEIDLSPDESAMEVVYEQFKAHGINLHIDAGPDSVDYVTGEKWGDLSGGNALEYVKDLKLENGNENWEELVDNNFSVARQSVFRYCIFADEIYGTISGVSNAIPGQYFIVADAGWVFDLGTTAIAGTFMHELGHTLGLSHGGISENGNIDYDTKYKANYLSIMNYSFQTSGLSGLNGIDAVNYNEYELPAIDESNIDESSGVDPYGVTSGSNIGTKWYQSSVELAVNPIAFASIDFNNNGTIETNVSTDINQDGKISVLQSVVSDWDNLIFAGGTIGANGVSNTSESSFYVEDDALEELTLEESIERGLIGTDGTCTVDSIEPTSLSTGISGQVITVTIQNLYNTDTAPTLRVTSDLLDSAYEEAVSLSGGESVTVEIPVKSIDDAGSYNITYELLCEDGTTESDTVEITVTDPEEVSVYVGATKDLIPDEDVKQLTISWESCNTDIVTVDNGVITALASGSTYVLGTIENGVTMVFLVDVTVGLTNPFTDVNTGHYFYNAVLWVVDNGITSGTSETTFSPFLTAERCQVVTFLWRAAGCPEPTSTENPFTDVNEGDYFYNAVLWAVEKGITTGTSDTTFSPFAKCERCQVVTFLYRYFGQPEVTNTSNPFTDVDTDDYFYNAVLWAVEEGVTSGTTATTFGPFVTCERCMVVTFLYRALGE